MSGCRPIHESIIVLSQISQPQAWKIHIFISTNLPTCCGPENISTPCTILANLSSREMLLLALACFCCVVGQQNIRNPDVLPYVVKPSYFNPTSRMLWLNYSLQIYLLRYGSSFRRYGRGYTPIWSVKQVITALAPLFLGGTDFHC
jgi:hypothetical protein